MISTAQEGFVPLAMAQPNQGVKQDFRILLAPSPEKARSLRDSAPAPDAGPGPHVSPEKCQPRVVLHRDGGRVMGIHIQCSCGQVIDLSCSYIEETPAKATP